MRFFSLCLVLGSIFVCSACKKAKPSVTDTVTPDGPGVVTTAGANNSVPASFTSEQLHKMFKSDPKGFETKYKGKLVEVTGRVRDLGQWRDRKSGNAQLGNVQLVGDPNLRFDSLGCRTVDPDPWKTALPGQTVTITGTFDTMSGLLPEVRAAKITRVEGEAHPTRDAAKLGAELLASPVAVEARFRSPIPEPGANSTSLIFVGKFLKTEVRFAAEKEIWILDGPKGVKMYLVFSLLLANRPATPQPGQEVKYVSNCLPSADNKTIEFSDALVVSVK